MQKSKNCKKVLIQAIMLASTTTLLSGCLDPSEDDAVTPSDHYAVISTQGDGSGDISIISLEDYSADNTNYVGKTDTVVSTHDEYFYRIGRFEEDNVTKFKIDEPDTFLWQFTANEEGKEKSNPYKLVVKDDNTGYLIRYGSAKIGIVNPSANNLAEFRIGEIDLSHYATDDGIPEAADALLIENKLYVLMQNMDSRGSIWVPGIAYMAVFDTADNSEIDTNTNNDALKGIPLSVTNPNKMEYLATNSTIYISAVGPYSPADYSGGIESIDLTNFSTKIVVDDGNIDNHPYGQINNIAILNSTRGYFVGYSAWKDTALYSFNPSTGDVDPIPLMANKDISDIEIGPLGNLWVANRNESGITIFDTVDNSIFQALIDTDLLPIDIDFVSVKKSD